MVRIWSKLRWLKSGTWFSPQFTIRLKRIGVRGRIQLFI